MVNWIGWCLMALLMYTVLSWPLKGLCPVLYTPLIFNIRWYHSAVIHSSARQRHRHRHLSSFLPSIHPSIPYLFSCSFVSSHLYPQPCLVSFCSDFRTKTSIVPIGVPFDSTQLDSFSYDLSIICCCPHYENYDWFGARDATTITTTTTTTTITTAIATDVDASATAVKFLIRAVTA